MRLTAWGSKTYNCAPLVVYPAAHPATRPEPAASTARVRLTHPSAEIVISIVGEIDMGMTRTWPGGCDVLGLYLLSPQTHHGVIGGARLHFL